MTLEMCVSGTTMSHIVKFSQITSLLHPHHPHYLQINAVCELQHSFTRLVFSSYESYKSYKESDRGW